MRERLTVGKHISLYNPQYITIGDNVIINNNTSLFINPIGSNAQLIIGNGVQLGKYTDIGCSNKIIIENDVITAPYVHITDRDHSYDDIHTPIMYQTANSKGPVIIKEGVWLVWSTNYERSNNRQTICCSSRKYRNKRHTRLFCSSRAIRRKSLKNIVLPVKNGKKYEYEI